MFTPEEHQGLVPVSYGMHENYTAARIATLSKREGLARRPDCNATLRTFRSKKGKVNQSLAFVICSTSWS